MSKVYRYSVIHLIFHIILTRLLSLRSRIFIEEESSFDGIFAWYNIKICKWKFLFLQNPIDECNFFQKKKKNGFTFDLYYSPSIPFHNFGVFHA